MNAKTCLATTGEGIARAELAPYGNWDVWAYGMRQAQYACLAGSPPVGILCMLGMFASFTRKMLDRIRYPASKERILGILCMLGS